MLNVKKSVDRFDFLVSCTYNITLSPNYELSPKNQGLDTLYGMFSTSF